MMSSTAYHEAGHAVVGALLGAEIQEVTQRGSFGQTHLYYPDDAESTLVLLWAGPVAEAMAEGRIVGLNVVDQGEMIAEAQRLGVSRAAAWTRALSFMGYAQRLCEEYWPVIDQLARELTAAGRVDGARVHALVSG